VCANKVVAWVLYSSHLPNIRRISIGQYASAQKFIQLEGLAGATPWRFESSLPHQQLTAIRRCEMCGAVPLA